MFFQVSNVATGVISDVATGVIDKHPERDSALCGDMFLDHV
jgi:hypothetical protein